MLTPGRQNNIIDSEKATVQIALLSMKDAKARWNTTPELLECAYLSREFTHDWFKTPKYRDYWPLSTTQNELTIDNYVIDELRPFQY